MLVKIRLDEGKELQPLEVVGRQHCKENSFKD